MEYSDSNIVESIARMQDQINKDKYNIDAILIESAFEKEVTIVEVDDSRISSISDILRRMKDELRHYKAEFGNYTISNDGKWSFKK